MKLTGITGTGSGKLGSSVFAVNSGVQIVRQYQPVVANPSTDGQVQQRAKLKLASQLARDLKKSIVIKKQGIVSSRNRFMSENFGAISYANDTASVNLNAIQLTEGSLSMFAILSLAFSVASLGYGKFADYITGQFENFVFSIYRKTTDNNLAFVAEEVVKGTTIDALEGGFNLTKAKTGDIVFAYGINPLNESARAKYTDMVVNAGLTTASLMSSTNVNSSDYETSHTVSAVVTSAE